MYSGPTFLWRKSLIICTVADCYNFTFEGEYDSQIIESRLYRTLDNTDQYCLESEHAERILTYIQFTPKEDITLLQEK